MSDNTLKLRDPIHNFITLDDKEHRLLDTQAMQRLRGIRQLALANLVYPGALHTRFDHSLGVMHVAGQMAEKLFKKDEDVELLRHAALLHDIGHGPFSHVSEYALDRYADRSKLSDTQKKDKIHELVTAGIIRTDQEIQGILGGRHCEEVVTLLSAGLGESALKSVVSGPLDADKQDYLLRDSQFCGVRYGIFDLEQLHRALCIDRQSGSHDRQLAIKPDSIHAVEQYILAKYYMTTNVYRHKVRLITDQMIVRAICLGIDVDEIEELHDLYAYDASEAFLKQYQTWDDARFFEVFAGERFAGKLSHALLSRLRTRNLLKRVFHVEGARFSASARDALFEKEVLKNQGLRDELEHGIGEKIESFFKNSIDKRFVILHVFTISSVKDMARNYEAGITVLDYPKPRFFDEASRLFASIDEGFKEQFIEVYAPVTWPSRERRDDLCNGVRQSIIEEIERACAGERNNENV